MKRWLSRTAALAAVLGAGGFLVAASGIVPIRASSGHWAITSWFLRFALRRSVATHTLGLEVPALDEPWLVLKGAAHYETGCRPCHGGPGSAQPAIPLGMTPRPPRFPSMLAGLEPAELFYIVKHGVKFTGMPAWPALQRDDEVWAMVAFLRRLPGLNAEEYGQLVDVEGTAPLPGLPRPDMAPRAVASSCARCHGLDGRGRGPAFPRLAAQRAEYLSLSLQAFARGSRHSGIMAPVAASLAVEDYDELPRYFASLPPPSPSPPRPESARAIERGRSIAREGIRPQRVPSCAHCHGPGPARRNPAYPELAGQHADYLMLQLSLFKSERRGGTAYAHLMRPVAAGLTREQMRDVALYYESLTPAGDVLAR